MSLSNNLTDVVSSENDPGVLDDNLKRKAVARQPAVVVVDLAQENPRDSTLGTRKRARLANLINNNNNITVDKDERGAPCSNNTDNNTRRQPGQASAQVRKDSRMLLGEPGSSQGTRVGSRGAQVKQEGSAQVKHESGAQVKQEGSAQVKHESGAQNHKENEDSDTDTDNTEPMEDEEREDYMVSEINDVVSFLPPNSKEVVLILSAMAAEKQGAMRRLLLRLCLRLGHTARKRQEFEKTVTTAANDKRQAEEALVKSRNKANDLHFSLMHERRMNRKLSFGIQRFMRLEEAGRFTLTDAEKEELRKVKELVVSDEDVTWDD